MDTHPRSAMDAEDTGAQIASGDLPTLVRTIDPILLRMIEGVQKGTVGTVELVDIAVRIRTILHDAVRAASDGEPRRHSGVAHPAGGPRDGSGAHAVS